MIVWEACLSSGIPSQHIQPAEENLGLFCLSHVHSSQYRAQYHWHLMDAKMEPPLMKQHSITRKPVGRKSVAAPSPQNHHSSSIEPLSSNPAHGPSPTQNSPCELPGSAVPFPFRSESNHGASMDSNAVEVLRPPSPQCTLEVSPSSNNGANPVLGSHPVRTEQVVINQIPLQSEGLEVSAGSDGHRVAISEKETALTINKPSTNQARRFQRRTMMMSITANVGGTSQPPAAHPLGGPLSQPGYRQSVSPALSPGPFAQAASSSHTGLPSPGHPPAQAGSFVPIYPTNPVASQPSPAIAVQNNLSAAPFTFPPRPIQNSAFPGGSSPQELPSNPPIEANFKAQINQPTQQFHNHMGPQMTSWPAPSSGSQVQTALNPMVVLSSVQNGAPGQRSPSMQSAQTVSSSASVRSDPNNASPTGSPLTNITSPSAVGSPFSPGPQALHRPLFSAPNSSASYFSLCSSCRTGNMTSARFAAEPVNLMTDRTEFIHLVL